MQESDENINIVPQSQHEYQSCQILVDNSENILKIMKNLFTEKQMCDVTFIVGNKEYSAHRLILCASSDVFQIMLMKPEWSEWHESRVQLQELPQCESVFPLFLEYFYTGKILITHTNVMPVLALADKYMVKGLSRLCLHYMCKHVPHAASHNQLFSWLQYALPCGHMEVARTCQNYLKWNFEAVANTPDFSNVDEDVLIDILMQDDIIVYNEMVLFNCVMRWLDLQRVRLIQTEQLELDQLNRRMNQLVESVMQCIRFPMMTPRELADLLLSPLVKQYKEFFVDRMSIGMSFHSGQKDRIDRISTTEIGRKLFIPRLYTSDSYCTTLIIDNFNSLPYYHTSTFVFSSHNSAAECEADKMSEWVVDLYPKGVWFQQCLLIVWQGTLEVPEEILKTVRLSLTCRDLSDPQLKLKISVLVYGIQGGIEHVMNVRETLCHFTGQKRIVNIDNVVPFEDLNPSAIKTANFTSPYLIGINGDQLKLRVIIAPASS